MWVYYTVEKERVKEDEYLTDEFDHHRMTMILEI